MFLLQNDRGKSVKSVAVGKERRIKKIKRGPRRPMPLVLQGKKAALAHKVKGLRRKRRIFGERKEAPKKSGIRDYDYRRSDEWPKPLREKRKNLSEGRKKVGDSMEHKELLRKRGTTYD